MTTRNVMNSLLPIYVSVFVSINLRRCARTPFHPSWSANLECSIDRKERNQNSATPLRGTAVPKQSKRTACDSFARKFSIGLVAFGLPPNTTQISTTFPRPIRKCHRSRLRQRSEIRKRNQSHTTSNNLFFGSSFSLPLQVFATCSTFYVPLLVILVLYWKIYQTARKRIHRRRPKQIISANNNQVIVCFRSDFVFFSRFFSALHKRPCTRSHCVRCA